MESDVALHVVDYVVIVLVLLVPLGIGIFFAVKDAKRATLDEYLVGGRRMSILPVTLSIFATYMSAITFLGIPAEIYTYGPMYPTNLIGWGITYLGVAFQIVPLIYPLRLISLYEYLEMRFESKLIRIIAVVIGILQTLGFMSIALLAPALALQAGAGLPIWMSVGIVGFIGTIYTSVGGIKSVMWTDSFQSVIMFVCIFSVIIKAPRLHSGDFYPVYLNQRWTLYPYVTPSRSAPPLYEPEILVYIYNKTARSLTVGGGSTPWLLAQEGGRTSFNSFSPDPRTRHSWWGTIIGGSVFWYGMACNQSGIQRMSAMRSAKEAKKAFLMNSFLVILYGLLLLGVGIVIYAYFHHISCDPFAAGIIKNRNQLSLYFVMHAFQGTLGMAGLYLAAVFSSALSTISSGINSMAANTVEDIFKTPLSKVTESTATVITKFVVSVYGVLIIGLAYAANNLEGTVTQLSVTANSACGGPLFGLLLLGAISPWTNKYGALGGVIIGLVLNLWIALGNQLYAAKPKTLPPISGSCGGNSSQFNFTSTYLGDTNASFPLSHNGSESLRVSDDRQVSSFFFYNISYEWYGFIGIFVTLFCGSVISYCTKNYSKPSRKPELLLPCVRKLWKLPDIRHSEDDKFVGDTIQDLKMIDLEKEDEYKADLANVYLNNKGRKVNNKDLFT